MSDRDHTWIFGYGSLMWRPAFDPVERVAGFIEGFARRFWQASPDHRGVPQAPGRVVTLVPDPAARCFGIAYRIAVDHEAPVLAALDHRERNGYTRHVVRVHRRDGAPIDGALVYIAGPDNPSFTGPTDLPHDGIAHVDVADDDIARIAAIVSTARGPSGSNRDYVQRLAASLRAIDAHDSHVFAVADAVAAIASRNRGGRLTARAR